MAEFHVLAQAIQHAFSLHPRENVALWTYYNRVLPMRELPRSLGRVKCLRVHAERTVEDFRLQGNYKVALDWFDHSCSLREVEVSIESRLEGWEGADPLAGVPPNALMR